MAESAQNIDTIGVGLTLDTSGFDANLAKSRTALASFERTRAATLRAPQTMAIAPMFKVTQAQVRGLRVDINQHMTSMAARNEAVAIPVKLGQSDWAGMRQQITQKIGTVPISVSVAGGGSAGLRAGARGGVAGRADPVQVLAAWIAQTQGLSLPNAQTQLIRAARSKGIAGRASGGPVVQDRDYLVGEQGPEVVRFKQPAMVYPRHHGGYSGGGTVKPISYGPGFAHRMGGGPITRTFTVQDPNGLHMRPAGAFSRAVALHNAQVSGTNLTNGQTLVNPASIYDWMTLGARKGHKVQITTQGDDARSAMGMFAKLMRFNPEKTGMSYGEFHESLGVRNPLLRGRRQGGGSVEGTARAEFERLLAKYKTPADRLYRPWKPGDTSLDSPIYPELEITDDAWLPAGKYERGFEPDRRRPKFKVNQAHVGRRFGWKAVAPPGVRGPAAAYAATHEFGHYFDDTVAGVGHMGDGRTYAASPLDAAFHHAMMELDMGFDPEESWLRRRQWASPDDLTKHLSPFPTERLSKLPSLYADKRPGEASAEYFAAVERQPKKLWTPGTQHMAGVLEGHRRDRGGYTSSLGWTKPLPDAMLSPELEQHPRGAEVRSYIDRLIRLSPKAFGSVSTEIRGYPGQSFNRGGTAAHWSEFDQAVRIEPDYLERASEGSLRETINHEFGHALHSYVRSRSMQSGRLAHQFDFLGLKGGPISRYPIERFEDVYEGMKKRGHKPVYAAKDALDAALHENFAETFAAMGEPTRMTRASDIFHEMSLASGGQWIPGGIGMGIPRDEVTRDEWNDILQQRFGTHRYLDPSGEFHAPLGVWNRRLRGPGQMELGDAVGSAKSRSLELRQAMSGIIRAVNKRVRGGRVNRPGRGGKYGAAKAIYQSPDMHTRGFPGSEWPREDVEDTGFLYHGTFDIDDIRGMGRKGYDGQVRRGEFGSGVQPSAENRHLTGTTMGFTSYWGLNSLTTSDYGNSLLRTKGNMGPRGLDEAADWYGPFSYDLDEPGVIATRSRGRGHSPQPEWWEDEDVAGVPYEMVPGERTIPRSKLQYYGSDDAWHKFRRGRRRAGGGAINPFAGSGLESELDFAFRPPGTKTQSLLPHRIGPLDAALMGRMRQQDIEHHMLLDPGASPKGWGQFVGIAAGEAGSVDPDDTRRPHWMPQAEVAKKFWMPNSKGEEKPLSLQGMVGIHNHPMAISKGVEAWRPSDADILTFLENEQAESWVGTPSWTSIMRRRKDTGLIGPYSTGQAMRRGIQKHFKGHDLTGEFANSPLVTGNYTMWKEIMSELATTAGFDFELWKHPQKSGGEQLSLNEYGRERGVVGFSRGGYMSTGGAAARYGKWAQERHEAAGGRGRLKITDQEIASALRGTGNVQDLIRLSQRNDPALSQAGREWYTEQPQIHDFEGRARSLGVTLRQFVDVVALMSSGAAWYADKSDAFSAAGVRRPVAGPNITTAESVIRHLQTGSGPTGGATGDMIEDARRYFGGEKMTAANFGPKRPAFADAFFDPNAFPIDRWQGRATTLGERHGVTFPKSDESLLEILMGKAVKGRDWSSADAPTPSQRRASVYAVSEVAKLLGMEPRGVQAESWTEIKRLEGVGNKLFRLDKKSGLALPRQGGGKVGGPGEGILKPWSREESVRHLYELDEQTERAYDLFWDPQYKGDRAKFASGMGGFGDAEPGMLKELLKASANRILKIQEGRRAAERTEILHPDMGRDYLIEGIDAALKRLPEAMQEPGMSRAFNIRNLPNVTDLVTGMESSYMPKEGAARPWDRTSPNRYKRANMPRAPHAMFDDDEFMRDRRNAQGGHERGAQTYLVGELHPELFIPDRLRYIIPPDVMDKLPKRAGGGETRRMGSSGVTEVGTRGPHLFTPPEDGWIIPHTLVGRVNPLIPRAARGSRVGLGPMGLEDLVTGNLGPRNRTERSEYDEAMATAEGLVAGLRQDAVGAAQALAGRTFPSAVVGTATAGGRKAQFERGLIASTQIAKLEATIRQELGAVGEGKVAARRLDQLQGVPAALQAQRAGFVGQRASIPGYAEARTRLAAMGEATPSQTRIAQFARERKAAGETWARALVTNENTINTLTKQFNATNKAITHYQGSVTAGAEANENIRIQAEKTAKAVQDAQPSAVAKLKNLGTVFGAQFIAANIVMGGVSKLLQGAQPGISRWVDTLTGFAETNAQVTSQLGAASRQRGGRVGETIAAQGMGAGVSATAIDFLVERLSLGVTAKGAAQAESEVGDLFKAAAGNQAPSGLYGGYGGVLGSSFLAEGLGGGRGFTETLRGNLEGMMGVDQGPFGGQDLGGMLSMGLDYLTNENFRAYIDKQADEARAAEEAAAAANPPVDVQTGFNPGMIPGGLGDVLSSFNPLGQNFIGAGGPMKNAQGVPYVFPGQVPAGTTEQRPGERYADRVVDPMAGLTPDAQKMTTAYLNDLTESAKRGAQALGEHTKVTWKLVEAGSAEAEAFTDAAAMAGDANGVSLGMRGIVMEGVNTKEEYQRGIEQTARGRSIPDVNTWAKTIGQALRASREATGEQLATDLAVSIPASLDQALAQNPLQSRRQILREIGPLGQLEPQERRRVRRQATVAAGENRALEDRAEVGREAAVGFITTNLDATQATAYSDALDQATGYGREILQLQTRISRINMAQRAKEFVAQMILANRALQDALGLAGRGGSRFGQLQRQDYFLGRESQSLSMGLQQKQINFQVATAGFTAQGVTGEEVAAKQTQAKIEASYAQQQLDIEKERFAIALQMFNISNERAVADARRSRDLLAASYENEKVMAAIVKEIKAKEIAQQEAMQRAQAIFQAANKNYGEILGEARGYVAQFGDTIRVATEALRTVLGFTDPKKTPSGNGNADGFLGTVTGATNMLMGEAGTETVAILRNPRTAAMPAAPAAGGGGPTVLTINMVGAVVRDDADVQKIAAAIEERINRRVGLLGLRTPGG